MEESVNLTIQGFTDYQLTDKEKILLEILLNPEHRMKTITDICKLANCSRPIYYDAMAKPGFMALYEQKTKDLVRQAVGPVVNTFVREALRGSFQHGKVILEMAGLYTERKEVDVSGEIDHFAHLSRDERRDRIAQLIGKNVVEAEYEVIPEVSQQTTDKSNTGNGDK